MNNPEKQSRDFTQDWLAFNGFRLCIALTLISTILDPQLPVLSNCLWIISGILIIMVVVRSILCGIGKCPVKVNLRINNFMSWWLTIPYLAFFSGIWSFAKGDTGSGWLQVGLGIILTLGLLVPSKSRK